MRIIDVARNTGVPYSTFTDWKAGRYTPKIDKLEKIANYFNVPVDYFKTGQLEEKTSAEGNKYYFDDNTAAVAVLRDSDLCDSYFSHVSVSQSNCATGKLFSRANLSYTIGAASGVWTSSTS